MSSNTVFLRRLRWLSRVEGVSTLLLLFVAMPLKYVAGKPLATSIVGSVHGALFVILCCALLLAVPKVRLPISTAFLGMIAAVVPFGPFWFDRKLVQNSESCEQNSTSENT